MLPEALTELAHVVRDLAFMPPTDSRADVLALRERLAREAEAHAARLVDRAAPLLWVLGGGTGAGKSTLLNSLAGRVVSPVSAIRPTTATPTLLVSPGDLRWAEAEALPAGLRAPPGVDGGSGRDALVVAVAPGLPAGLALLDTPDIDSVERANRAYADLLLDAADGWLWCTTAQTYADDASMAYLRRAARRRTGLGIVLNRVHQADTAEVVADLRHKLAAEGIGGVTLHVVPFHHGAGAMLPPALVEPVAAWLAGLAEPRTRERLRRRTVDGALDALGDEVAPLIAALQDDWRVVRRLQEASDRAFHSAWTPFEAELDRGPPLSRAMLRRWADFVGTNRFAELAESLTGQVSGVLARVQAFVAGREERHLDQQVREDLSERLARTAVEVLDLASAEVAAEWDTLPAGETLLRTDPSLRRAGPGLGEVAHREMQRWIADVDDLIATTFAERRGRARLSAGAVNVVATTAIVGVFTVSGGLTGAEVGIAGAAAVTQQAVLTKVLGERNLTWLLAQIQALLRSRVEELAMTERRRYTAAVAELAPDPDQAERLLDAVAAVHAARITGRA